MDVVEIGSLFKLVVELHEHRRHTDRAKGGKILIRQVQIPSESVNGTNWEFVDKSFLE